MRWRVEEPAQIPAADSLRGTAATIAALRTALSLWQRQDGQEPISALFLAQVQRLREGLV